MNKTTLLRDYLHLQLFKLKKTSVQESKQKSEMLIQHCLKISKADIYLKDILLDKKMGESSSKVLWEDLSQEVKSGKQSAFSAAWSWVYKNLVS